jgi:hypothetical protein
MYPDYLLGMHSGSNISSSISRFRILFCNYFEKKEIMKELVKESVVS